MFLTFSVILVTLVVQGLLLPSVIRILGLANAGRRERHDDRAEEQEARRAAIETVIAEIERLASDRGLPDDVIVPLRNHHRERLRHIEHRSDGDGNHRATSAIHNELEMLLIDAERQRINQLFREGKLKDEARRRIERELDLSEARLLNQQNE